ncbi:DUF1361 domain-containing protein [uncultured Ilyobacter sp.]|uniref:DUF1361 domain-containing protein n=1 Tax=uncultured Ilyobacter sp. TaxID=544433 RepID=UPI0029F5B832|nr:DUF1361 domain-containing protein [uncultured Ilyobacter sp.]
MGRFIRLNSWDIVMRAHKLAKSILESLQIETLLFIFIFRSFLILLYIAFYNLTKINVEKTSP